MNALALALSWMPCRGLGLRVEGSHVIMHDGAGAGEGGFGSRVRVGLGRGRVRVTVM